MKASNLVEMLYKTVKKFPQKNAFMWKEKGNYLRMTYETFWEKIYHIASGFAHLGIKTNDKVAILSNNNPAWGITDFALASIGAVSVPIYPTLPVEQTEFLLHNGDVKAVVVEDQEQYDKIMSSNAQLDYIIVIYPPEGFLTEGKHMTFSYLEDLGEKHLLKDWENNWRMIDRDQLATIIHTSGTTGKPKGSMLTHGNFLSNVEAIQFWMIEILPEDIALSYLPLSHVFERMAGHYTLLSVGVTIAYAESIDTIQENLQEVRPTIMTSVPRLFEKIYAMVREEIDNGSTLKQKIFNWAIKIGEERYEHYLNASVDQLILGEAMPKSLERKWNIANRLVYQKVKDNLGGRIRGMVSGGGTLNEQITKFFWALNIPILEGYGLTETAPVITTNPIVHAKAGTVGRVLPNIEVKIAKDGEVLVRGPSVMKGYYKNEEATAESFDGDWFLTGDIGEIDDEGYLKIIDRKKRVLVLSTGKNVVPQPIENAINESSYIGHSLVVGDRQKYIICLVNPDYESLLPWARRNGIKSDSLEEICQDERVIRLLHQEVEKYTREFADFEKPKKVLIISEEWTVDSGELTPKLSMRINVIQEKYRDLIQAAYDEDETYTKAEEVVVAQGHQS